MRLVGIILCSMVVLFGQTSFALTQTEKKIVDFVQQDKKQEIQFIEKTVNINSSTFNKEGVKEVAKLYSKALQELGFKTQWIALPDDMQRAGHLFAYGPGKTGKKVLLLGHMDTVFDKNSLFQTYRRQGNIATGPGVVDMKGGNAIIIYALKALKEANLLNDIQIVVALMGDEEMPGVPKAVSRKKLIEEGNSSDMVLGFESAKDLHEVVTARRGLAIWDLTVQGKQGHSSLVSTKIFGEGAILGLSDILSKLHDIQSNYQMLSLNPGMIAGGINVQKGQEVNHWTIEGRFNVIAPHAISHGDIRYLSKKELRSFEKQCVETAEALSPPLQAEFKIEKENILPSMELTEKNTQLMNLISKTNEALGFGPLIAIDPRQKGAADIAYIDSSIPAVDGLGAVGEFDHSADEFMKIDETIDATKRLALFLYQLSKTTDKKE